ncbi:MAG TPA: lipoprotein [Sphingobacteriaceae bacterium]
MKKIFVFILLTTAILTGCSTIQSIVRSTFPYTATLIIPASARTGTTLSATSQASSIDQVFKGDGNANTRVEQMRITSAKIEAVNPSSQSMGAFQSVKLFLSRSDSSEEIMVASRTDISASTGNNLVLDVNSSRFLDEYLKGSGIKIRMEYVLRNQLNADASVRAALSFSSAPAQ